MIPLPEGAASEPGHAAAIRLGGWSNSDPASGARPAADCGWLIALKNSFAMIV